MPDTPLPSEDKRALVHTDSSATRFYHDFPALNHALSDYHIHYDFTEFDADRRADRIRAVLDTGVDPGNLAFLEALEARDEAADEYRERNLLRPRLQRWLWLRRDGNVQHWLWSGPVQKSTGVPIFWRYRGHKQVPVHRVLWLLLRNDSAPLVGRRRLRRLQECKYDLCVNPNCFVLAETPMEAETLPDYLSQPLDPRLKAQGPGRTGRFYKLRSPEVESLADDFVYRGEHHAVRWRCDNDECQSAGVLRLPMCPNGHIVQLPWADPQRPWLADEMVGKRYHCPTCRKIGDAARKLRGSRPRAGFRPTSPSHNNLSRELADTMRMLPTSEYEGSFERELDEVEAEISELSEPDE